MFVSITRTLLRMRGVLLLLIAYFLTTQSVAAQQHTIAPQLQKADSLLHAFQVDSASTILQEYLQKSQSNPLYSIYDIGRAYQETAELFANYQYFSKALRTCQNGIVFLSTQEVLPYGMLGELHSMIGKIQHHLQLGPPTIDSYTQAMKMYEKANNPSYEVALVELYILFGNTYFQSNDFGLAVSYYNKAIQKLEQLDSSVRPDVAQLHLKIGLALKKTGAMKAAETSLKTGLQITKEIYGTTHINNRVFYRELAYLYIHQKNFEEGQQFAKEALRLYLQNIESKSEAIAFQEQMAIAFFTAAAYELSFYWYHNLLQQLITQKGKAEAPQIGLRYLQIGQKFVLAEAYTFAIQSYTIALGLYNQTFGRNNLKSAKIIGNLIDLYVKSGDIANAKRCQQEKVKIYQILAENSYTEAEDLFDVASLFQLEGNTDSATVYYQELLLKFEQHPKWYPTSINNLSMLFFQKKDYDTSLKYALLLKRYYNDHYQANHMKVLGSDLLLGNIYYAMGNTTQALYHYQKVQHHKKSLLKLFNEVALQANLNLSDFYDQKGELRNARAYKSIAKEIEKELHPNISFY
ncbi:hypothetical protein [Algivirga pacifica]|uniref:Tetratricopeptide repeat-containing protein n=1 Tax=Algivirga pacifica TaxID=1162670 RepID=A0ABP9DC19_9BACT